MPKINLPCSELPEVVVFENKKLLVVLKCLSPGPKATQPQIKVIIPTIDTPKISEIIKLG